MSSWQAELEEADKVDYWIKRFDALSDESDSTIHLLKKENQQLREQVDRFKGQCSSTSIEEENLSLMVKSEPQDDVAVTETHPSSIAAGELSGNGIYNSINTTCMSVTITRSIQLQSNDNQV